MNITITIATIVLLSTSVFSNDIKITNLNDTTKFENLIWEDKKNVTLEEKSWNYAKNYCKNLKLGNKKWRLPSFDELKSLNNQSKTKNIIKNDYYWSSSKNPDENNEMIIFDISNQNRCDGLINEDTYYTLCVTNDK